MALNAVFKADFSNFYDAIQKAQVKLVDLSEGANKVGTTLDRMTKGFSGQKIIQDAHLMTAAMVNVGGVTSLTDKELRKLNATVTEASDKMRRMGIDVPPGFKKIQDAAEKLDKPTKGITTSMIAFGSAVGTFVGKLAYDAVRALGSQIVDLATNGVKLAPVVTAFERLTRSVGLSGDEMIRVTRTATKGLVTDLDIMAASNKALLLGLPVTAQSMGLMGAAATALGKAMKQDASKSLDDLITALGRSSPMILDNLGLTVKVGEANEKYARQVGKSAESMSDAEKKLAFYNAAMDAAKVKVEQLGGVHLSLADQVTRVRNQFTNFTDALGVAVARSPVLEAAFGTLADEMDTAFGANQVKRVQDLTKWVNEVGIAAIGVAGSFVEVGRIGTRSWTFLTDGVLGLLEAQFRVRAGLRDLIPMEQYREEAKILRAMADSLRDQAADANTQQGRLEKTFDAAAAAVGRMQARMIAAKDTQVDTAAIASDLTNKMGTQAEVSKDVADALRDIAAAAKPLTDVQKAQVREWERMGVSAETAAKALGVNRVAVTNLLEADKLLTKEIQTVNAEIAEFAKLVGSQSLLSGLNQIRNDTVAVTGSLEGWTATMQKSAERFPDWTGKLETWTEAWNKSHKKVKETPPLMMSVNKALSGVEQVLGGVQTKWAQMSTIAVRAIEAVSTKLAAGDWVGALVAAGAALGQFVIRLFKSEESAKVSPLRDLFFESAGGLDVLNPKVLQLTGSLQLVENIFKARTVDQYNAALKELNDLLAFQDQAMRTLDETAKKYNLTIEEMGPAWQRQELDKKAQELFKDYQVLTSAGVDHTIVLGKMATAVNAYVQNALKMGMEVPQAMRPMLDAMVKSGTLLDANGNKILSLEEAGVSFAMTMSEGFKALITEVQKLTDAIARGLGLAIKNIPDGDFTVKGHVDLPKNFPKEYELDIPAMASGGSGRVTKPTLFLAGEAGVEDYAFSGGGKRFGGASDVSSGERETDPELKALRRDMARRDRMLPHILTAAFKDAQAHS